MEEQVVTLVLANNHYFDDVPKKEVKARQKEILAMFHEKEAAVMGELREKKVLDDDLVRKICDAVKQEGEA
jgi:F-type H+-transporting ATPase subunit alpha